MSDPSCTPSQASLHVRWIKPVLHTRIYHYAIIISTSEHSTLRTSIILEVGRPLCLHHLLSHDLVLVLLALLRVLFEIIPILLLLNSQILSLRFILHRTYNFHQIAQRFPKTSNGAAYPILPRELRRVLRHVVQRLTVCCVVLVNTREPSSWQMRLE